MTSDLQLIPTVDEKGNRLTSEQITRLTTEANARVNGGYTSDTYSNNYALDRIESRRHKIRAHDSPELMRQRTIRERLQKKLIAGRA